MNPRGADPACAPACTPGSASGYDAVVVGGSAGAVEALAVLLPALPATLRAPVLVVVHLPRDRRSLLPAIFAGRCALALQEAQDKEPIAAGTVYFCPTDYHLLVDPGPRLALSVDAPVHFSRPSIDVLFESAADQYGERLVGVLLSGANEDGARGLAVVQDPATAPMPAMPAAAVLACGAADHALPPAGIAVLLARLHHQGQL